MEEMYKFVYRPSKPFEPLFTEESLIFADKGDREEILSLDFFDDEYEVDRFTQEKSIYLLRQEGKLIALGSLIPAYWREDLTDPDIREVGMYVSPQYRGRNLGRSMVWLMTQICLEKGLVPIAECLFSNKASRATLESIGYVLDIRINVCTVHDGISVRALAQDNSVIAHADSVKTNDGYSFGPVEIRPEFENSGIEEKILSFIREGLF
ncbi:MAG: GNAT family N-acetyltransferase [Oscillospiraceae bacterium]|nr:GNAT family N-acetyltransferase [Oscillospiraceae bacterium]